VGVLEIPLQTAGTEPIYVAPPQVIVRDRQPNITTGLVAILPLGAQGSDSARLPTCFVSGEVAAWLGDGGRGWMCRLNRYYEA
jgi:hypothetical protein